MHRTSALWGLLAVLCSVVSGVEPDAVLQTGTQERTQQPVSHSAGTEFIDSRAVSIMKSLFSKPASIFKSDKNILSLAQGKTTGGQPAPQTLAPFLAPFALPASAQTASWTNYNWMMMSFWYRFEFGFAIFR